MITTVLILALLLTGRSPALFALPMIVLNEGTRYEQRLSRGWAAIPLVLALVLVAFSCTAIVQAKEEGVLLTFGKPSDRTLSPGLSLKAPWQKVVSIDTTRQVDNYNDGEEETDHHVISVRLGNGNVSRVYASVSWAVNGDKANVVYGEFRGDEPTETVYQRLIAPNFKQAVNSTLGAYNPTAQIQQLSAAELTSAKDINLSPDFDQLAKDVRASFESRVDEGLVRVLDVQVSFLDFDSDTQKKINQYQDEVQKTIIAKQAIATAINQATANEKVAGSISKDPNVLASRCFDLIADGAFEPPAGFSCYPGGSGSVVVPSAR